MSTVMGRPSGRALSLFNVLHDVRCEKLLLCGPRVVQFYALFGRRATIGPGGDMFVYCSEGALAQGGGI